MSDMTCLQPSASVLVKLGTLVVRLENGDLQAAKDLQYDPEVERWFLEMDKLHLLPLKRA